MDLVIFTGRAAASGWDSKEISKRKEERNEISALTQGITRFEYINYKYNTIQYNTQLFFFFLSDLSNELHISLGDE